MNARRLAAAAGIAAALAGAPAGAQWPPCGDRRTAIDLLEKRFRESVSALGVTNDGAVFELLTAAGGVTWSVIVTFPDGRTCFVAAGRDWTEIRRPPGDPS